jgi:translation initiation factor IF-2
MAEPKPIGKVSSYFSHIGVAAIELTDKLKVGEKIRIKGNTTDLTQTVNSMQVNHKDIKEAKKGESIGVKVEDKVRPHDLVYKA